MIRPNAWAVEDGLQPVLALVADRHSVRPGGAGPGDRRGDRRIRPRGLGRFQHRAGTASQVIMSSADPEVEPLSRSTSPVTVMDGPCRSCRPAATSTTAPCSRRSWRGVEVCRPAPGRSPTGPGRVLADKGYSSRAVRPYLRRRHSPATIPGRRDQQANRLRPSRTGGRPPVFDRAVYQRRNTSSGAASTASSSSALSLPDSTRPRLPTEAWSTWPRCSSGFEDTPSARRFRGRGRRVPLPASGMLEA
ncbi:hypothetical protein SAMN04489730_2851 [Amycolatopsis australiensis]|uniref:Transposase DDE domain-containing protein n=1 Tax=Amycolatopsis australiensis TaxID=546364 RepID=A0A1K1R8C5_9PSEU|nr:hypothetical protein SAMN04489730_2851 [Amycolatopsis australiensis]